MSRGVKSGKNPSFWSHTRGATSIEYGLIAAILGITMIATNETIRDTVMSMFTTIDTGISGASNPTPDANSTE